MEYAEERGGGKKATFKSTDVDEDEGQIFHEHEVEDI